MKTYDFLIIGAGIFGLSTAIELAKRKHKVAILNPDKIPHPLAASTDISKIVRMEYGSDQEYMEMAIKSMEGWRGWNDLFGETLFHEVGFLLACSMPLEKSVYDFKSYQSIKKRGFEPVRMSANKYEELYPAFNASHFIDGMFQKTAGFVESGRSITVLVNYARQLGVDVFEGQTAVTFEVEKGNIRGVKTREGQRFQAGHIIVCAGNFTPYLVPDLQPYMKVTGHPVFHLKPSQPQLFTSDCFPVFAADISTTGWYGFPLHPKEGVVKIARHTEGLELHPEYDERIVYQEDIQNVRSFLSKTIPILANDPIVYTRRCCYTDTLDGHFWIDHHPEIKGLSIGSGGSGHGMKMGPVIGDMIATMAEGGSHQWAERYRWRELSEDTIQMEEARFLSNRSL